MLLNIPACTKKRPLLLETFKGTAHTDKWQGYLILRVMTTYLMSPNCSSGMECITALMRTFHSGVILNAESLAHIFL